MSEKFLGSWSDFRTSVKIKGANRGNSSMSPIGFLEPRKPLTCRQTFRLSALSVSTSLFLSPKMTHYWFIFVVRVLQRSFATFSMSGHMMQRTDKQNGSNWSIVIFFYKRSGGKREGHVFIALQKKTDKTALILSAFFLIITQVEYI